VSPKSAGRTPPIEVVREAFEVGRSVRQIADEWAVTVQTVRNVARRGRLTLPRTPRSYTLRTPRPSKYPTLYQPDWLAARLAAGRSLASIADEAGCSVSAVQTAIKRLAITDRRHHGEIRYPRLHDRRRLRQQYVGHQKSAAAIARELGASEVAVVRALKVARIKLRGRLGKILPNRRAPPGGLAPVRNVRAVARLNGVGEALAEVWLAEVGIFARATPAIAPEVLRSEVESGRSLRQIAARLGVDQRVVRIELRRLGEDLPGS
jgi:transposase-like protein